MIKRNFFFRPSLLQHFPQIYFRISSFFVLTLGLFSLEQTCHAKCINDYHIQQKKVPHPIPTMELKKLDGLARIGDLSLGWKIIGRWGEPYAFLAAKVISKGETFQDRLYQKLISVHWINTVGIKALRSRFHATARQHFKQYVGLLHSGYWPDSDQIILSYLTAARKNHLPDITVFDAAWEAAGFNRFRSWQSLNHFPESRIIYPSRICHNVNRFEAQKILAQDFRDLPFEFIFKL